MKIGFIRIQNPSKTESMIVSRSRTIFPPHADLFIGNTALNSFDSFKNLGIMFDIVNF